MVKLASELMCVEIFFVGSWLLAAYLLFFLHLHRMLTTTVVMTIIVFNYQFFIVVFVINTFV